jgi:hypothetical protein
MILIISLSREAKAWFLIYRTGLATPTIIKPRVVSIKLFLNSQSPWYHRELFCSSFSSSWRVAGKACQKDICLPGVLGFSPGQNLTICHLGNSVLPGVKCGVLIAGYPGAFFYGSVG